MNNVHPATLILRATIREDIPGYGSIVGSSDMDGQGRLVVGLGIGDKNGARDLEGLVEGDTFEFGGGTWQVSKIFPPLSAEAGDDEVVGGGSTVAELTRLSADHAHQ